MVFTNRGLSVMVNFLSSGTGSTATAPTHLELGSHAITPAITDDEMTGSYFRKAWTSNSVTNPNKNRYECLISTAEANNTTIRGVAAWNASESGDMFAINTITDLVKDATKEVQFDIEFTHADA